MSVTPEQLAAYYPRLYHMAHHDSWDGIRARGLLSTKALLDLFGIDAELRESILKRQRKKSFTIQHPSFGKAVIRDQKPLNRSKLEDCLHDCSFQQWLDMLNSRVFFWLTEERLQTLMCAREYCQQTHLVLTLDTLGLARDHARHITLAPMNTGNTMPIAHPRGLTTFYRMENYPYDEREKRGPYYRVVELAVEVGVPNVMDYVLQAAHMRCSACDNKGLKGIRTVAALFP